MIKKAINSDRLTWLMLFFLLVLFLPYIYLAFFVHPAADDFNYAFLTISKDWLSEYRNQYYVWNGRYGSNILVLLNPIAFNCFFIYRIIPIVLVLFTFLSVYFLLSTVYGTNLKNIIKVNISLTIILFYLFVMPNIAEGIYWYTGAVTYQLAIILGMIYISLLYRYFKEKFIISKIFHFILSAVLIILITGFNEITMILMLFFHTILLLTVYYKYKKNILLSILLFIIVLISSLFVFFAPGNEVKAKFFENNHQFFHSVVFSLLQTIRFIFDWLSNLPFLIFSVLFLFITKEINEKIDFFKATSLKKNIFWSFLIPIVVFLCIFPAYWSTGILGQHRTVNVGCFLFIILWLINLNLWAYYFKELPLLINIEKSLSKRSIIILFIFSLTAMEVTKNGYSAVTDIFYGKAYSFDKEMNERNDIIANAKKNSVDDLILKPIQNKPVTIFVLDITPDSSHWINYGFASYYGLKSVMAINK